MTIRIPLYREAFGPKRRLVASAGRLVATAFRYPTGVEALSLANGAGELVVLPFMGGMIWSASFGGVDLTMKSGFDMPRPARTIAETYGCFAFHSGLLRNGVPGSEDDHAAHGEFPCADMQSASLDIGEDEDGPFLKVSSYRDYVMAFGAHYDASPSVTLRAGDATLFDIGMEVQNRSGKPMELMYMAHVNFAFAEGARIVQPAPFAPERTAVRRAVPAHVTPDPDYLALIDDLAKDPSRMERLDEPARYDPEQVFYVRGLGTDAAGDTHLMLRRREGDGFAMSYAPKDFPHTVRWIFHDPDQQVAAFALPSTCESEGYAAEKRKGNVRMLAPGETATFKVRTGYLDAAAAAEQDKLISNLGAAT